MATVTLDPTDLKPEFQTGSGYGVDQKISTREVTFEKLNERAQQIVKAAGRAMFYSWDRQTYNAVYPPKE
jgi:hypothetical protein